MFWLTTGTLSVAFAEWLMFEYVRTPYWAPKAMESHLGGGTYWIAALMTCVGVCWLIFVATTLARCRFTIRDYFTILAILAITFALLAYLVENPRRDVTPWELLWQ